MIKKWKPKDQKQVFDTALFYCARRETSRPKLKLYLSRKFIDSNQTEDQNHAITQWIENVLNECERLKVIDHERFAGILSREYARRGKGRRYVEQKLKEKGLSEQVALVEFDPEDQLQKAILLAEKSLTRGSIAKTEDFFERRQKLLQKLVSSGFEYSIAKNAVELVLKRD